MKSNRDEGLSEVVLREGIRRRGLGSGGGRRCGCRKRGVRLGSFASGGGDWERPPLITLVYVAGLAHPDFLMEIEVLAVVPEKMQ